MSIARHKELYRRYQYPLRHPEILDDLLAPDFVAYDRPEGQRDVAGLKQFRKQVMGTLPDQSVTLDYLFAEDDLVGAHLTVTQTLPTGERMSFGYLEIAGVKGGRIAWRRGYGDDRFHALHQRAKQLSR